METGAEIVIKKLIRAIEMKIISVVELEAFMSKYGAVAAIKLDEFSLYVDYTKSVKEMC